MRMASFNDCLRVLEHYGIEPSSGTAIDVGGTEMVYLNQHGITEVARNPILQVKPDITFLDRGYNIDRLDTRADKKMDFLDRHAVEHLQNKFDLTFSFDTLEHISNPYIFCDHLVWITKPGGYIYVSTLFNFVYHPSPEDHFRFTPTGLRQCFVNPVNRFKNDITILWSGWENDGIGVGILVYKGLDKKADPNFSLPSPATSPYTTIHIKNPVLCKIIRAIAQVRRALLRKKPNA